MSEKVGMAVSPEVITWGALVAAGGSILAIIRSWVSFGKMQGEMSEQLKAALAIANRADNRSELTNMRLAELQVTFANQYVTQHDLAASEARVTAAVEKLETKVDKSFDGVTDRLDRLLEQRR